MYNYTIILCLLIATNSNSSDIFRYSPAEEQVIVAECNYINSHIQARFDTEIKKIVEDRNLDVTGFKLEKKLKEFDYSTKTFGFLTGNTCTFTLTRLHYIPTISITSTFDINTVTYAGTTAALNLIEEYHTQQLNTEYGYDSGYETDMDSYSEQDMSGSDDDWNTGGI